MCCRGFEGWGEDSLAGSDVGVEGEFLAQGDDGGGVAFYFCRWGAVWESEISLRCDWDSGMYVYLPDCSEECAVTFIVQCVDSLVRK